MSDIQAFRALRYNLGHVGSLSDVICPPYDVISPEFQNELYLRHPANFVRVELNRDEPLDDDKNNRYSRAAKFLKNWRSDGVLFAESQPAVYVYHQEFTADGQKYIRRGFMARCRLERFGEGNIFPHEETMSGPKADRLLLMKACKANLSQIFGLFPDPTNSAQELLEQATAGKTALEATDHQGVISRVWPVNDSAIVSKLSEIMGPKPVFIADGHHRYETACNYRDELAAAGKLSPNHPANFVLMMYVGMSDPGLVVLPTHRLFRGLPAMSASEFIAKLGDCFTCRLAGEGADLAQTVWDEIETAGEQGTIGFFTGQDERWVVAKITAKGRERMGNLAPEHSSEWQSLGVSILHRLVMDDLLGTTDLPKPKYVHTIQEVEASLEAGDSAARDATGVMGTAGRFELAALVMPATVDHIRTISQHGERMPAKSTYFYPKLLGGLVINPLDV
ncbi:MAG TPA: DUF1015 domain-containing protein [Pirellulales bacterium]|jgi:uncharacterized protein (DUF1015 family)|nr:DUF1015 domain-containing protein [Pirellulales bacterium]